MNSKRWILYPAVFLLVFLTSTAFAEPAPGSMTVDQAVDYALRNNLTVQTAGLEAALRKRLKDYSFNVLFPTLSVSTTASRLNEGPNPTLVAVSPPPATAGQYFTPDRENLGMNLKLQEVFAPAIVGQLRKIDIDYQNAVIAWEQAQRSLVATVKKFFYQLLVQKELIDLTQTRLKNSEERLRQSKVSYQLGQQPELTYIQNLVDVEGLKPQLQDLITTHANNLVLFQGVLGLEYREGLALVGSLDEETTTPPAPRQLAPFRLDLMAQNGSVAGLENALGAHDLSLLPNLIFQYSADPNINGPRNKNIFDPGVWRPSNGALSLTLSISLEGLIPGSGFWLTRAEIADRLALARENASQTQRNGLHDLENRGRSIQASLMKLENLKNSELANKRALELTTAGYQLGTGRLQDLQTAELNYQSAQIQLLSERFNLKSQIFDLEAQLDSDLPREDLPTKH